MSAKRWGKVLLIGIKVYFLFLVIVLLFLGQHDSVGLVPGLIIMLVLCLPMFVYDVLLRECWKCLSCQNRLPVNHSRSGRSMPIPDLSIPYCPKCGADIDVDIDAITSAFAPDTTLTRAMAVTILHRLAGEPTVSTYPAAIFSDVPPGQWFSDAVAWASRNEIVSWISDGYFAPHAGVTREQLAAMLHRYAAAMGFSVEVPEDFKLTAFPDYNQISTWANEAMRWAVYNRLFAEADAQGRLNPGGSAARAQCIAMLQRFVKGIE